MSVEDGVPLDSVATQTASHMCLGDVAEASFPRVIVTLFYDMLSITERSCAIHWHGCDFHRGQ